MISSFIAQGKQKMTNKVTRLLFYISRHIRDNYLSLSFEDRRRETAGPRLAGFRSTREHQRQISFRPRYVLVRDDDT
jgi:hypothetical protein